MRELRAGFIPLVDCAVLAVAARRGFAEEQGIALTLEREASWATLRDKLTVGVVDCAHLLAPIPVASQLQIGSPKARMVAPYTLSQNGNAIAVSNDLFDAMEATGRLGAPRDPAAKAEALAEVIRARQAKGEPKLTLGMVHAYSTHNYELRYWLASAGIHPDRDVELVVIPPPFIVDYMSQGLIDGFCVGAPWTNVGVRRGLAKVVVVKPDIWRVGPEKVLAVREDFAETEPETLVLLLRALKAAAVWADAPQNRAELAAILADEALLGLDAEMLEATLHGEIAIGRGPAEPIEDYFVFDRGAASFPWRSHALWFYSQMVRWGQALYSPENSMIAGRAFRPDIYRSAFAGTGITLPAANAKIEGSLAADIAAGSTTGRLILKRDGFFDGGVFDPADIETYIRSFAIRTELPLRTNSRAGE
ncbi:CmpA/NrtA family ABC transporter substrate-binding protein [Acuticoccus kandeliae]|uniref:CmpA/NrtA family ABC transporter substrate-binding protein n=1 Tax=Acuticoccus kandeliae TaxID=2073160 RepID=UPI000D3E6B59|nr:CmpA/NrtA family ABC transporter substrate-binding protein [Acuticoccus kandeliae]